MKTSRILMIVTMAVFLICNAVPVYAEPSGYPGGEKGRIVAIDYGECGMDGDAVLVESDGEYILMDTGYTDNEDLSQSSVIRYLKQNNIQKLDLYLSHWHNDHYYLMSTIIRDEYFDVRHVYLPYADHLLEFSSSEYSYNDWHHDLIKNLCIDGEPWGPHSYSEVYEAMAEADIVPIILHQGDTFQVGDAIFEVLWQRIDEMPEPEVDSALQLLNNSGLVTRVTIGGVRYLTAADTYKSVEKEMIEAGVDLKADIFKTSHHSNRSTSNCHEFFEAIDASWAFGTGSSSKPCNEGAEVSGTNYVNLKENGELIFNIYKGEITMSAKNEDSLIHIGRRYIDHNGNEHVKRFVFDKEHPYFFTENMIPVNCKYSGWGWQTINNHVYFYDESGKPVTGVMVKDGTIYTFDQDGVLIKCQSIYPKN